MIVQVVVMKSIRAGKDVSISYGDKCLFTCNCEPSNCVVLGLLTLRQSVMGFAAVGDRLTDVFCRSNLSNEIRP
ncbi:hypothetical protein PHMEG_0008549 [Phytophthora megakarya]|uniref:Uncharacterized protein n=1 Tax=Phytophthora megakarya TaxID=4795 RepID=A0A225WKX3_9STRA|nr:hypothetical protein PHMEG_0008549 [Phytophthora megakarya]